MHDGFNSGLVNPAADRMPPAAKPPAQPQNLQPSPAFQRHFTPKELAHLWGFDETTIRRLFIDEPGVFKYGSPYRRGKRQYISLRIPESVAARVHRERSK